MFILALETQYALKILTFVRFATLIGMLSSQLCLLDSIQCLLTQCNTWHYHKIMLFPGGSQSGSFALLCTNRATTSPTTVMIRMLGWGQAVPLSPTCLCL